MAAYTKSDRTNKQVQGLNGSKTIEIKDPLTGDVTEKEVVVDSGSVAKVNMLNSGELVLNMMPITCIWQQCIQKPRI